MHYVDAGSGPPVLMLHGNPTWSFYYRELIADLSADHRVIAPDHIGCGLSDKPRRYPYRLATHIDNVERLADRLGLEDITLAVHDWGGAIGFGLAARRPERVRRFVILNTAAFFGRVPWRIRMCRWPIFGPLAVRVANGFAGGAIRQACCNRQRMTPDVRAGYLLPYGSYADRVGVLRFIQDIPTRRSHPTHATIEAIEAALPTFRDRPMLIAWGMRDFCFDRQFLQGWIDRFPDAQAHRFELAGHYVLEDAAEEIIPLVRGFLTG
ncbi:MAG: alpha/beta fold hydrolase [bacterium]|nr:alpha/beta fold hydrolase [bacterium]